MAFTRSVGSIKSTNLNIDDSSLISNNSTITIDNSIIRGNHNRIYGHSNTIIGNDSTITGNNNIIYGHSNEIIGNDSTITGNNNIIDGECNHIYGYHNSVENGHTVILNDRRNSIHTTNVLRNRIGLKEDTINLKNVKIIIDSDTVIKIFDWTCGIIYRIGKGTYNYIVEHFKSRGRYIRNNEKINIPIEESAITNNDEVEMYPQLTEDLSYQSNLRPELCSLPREEWRSEPSDLLRSAHEQSDISRPYSPRATMVKSRYKLPREYSPEEAEEYLNASAPDLEF